MKKAWKLASITLAAAVVFIAAAYCVFRFCFSVDPLDRSGWGSEEGGIRYLDYWGKPLTGWQDLEGARYYFDPADGTATVGWRAMDGKDYYFDASGRMQTGWVNTFEGRFLLDSEGAALYGWQQDSQGLRYVDPENGRLTGWQQLDGKQYCFGSDGILLTGWQEVSGKTYYFGEDGIMRTGWQDRPEGRSYLGSDGAALIGWQDLEGERYCFDKTGVACTGLYTKDSSTWLLDGDGKMLTGWQDTGGSRRYFGTDGVMHTGWLEQDGERYYLHKDGTMAIGKVEIDGVNRFFTSQGKYLVMVNPWNFVPEDYQLNMTKVEGFEFDVSGADALARMLADCRAAGYSCTVNNTYRSEETQRYIWNRWIDRRMAAGMTYEEACAVTAQRVAAVGTSEHHLGLAVDLDGSSAMEAWMDEHCWDYGFIVRYPDGKTDVTGIIYEPWHFRYVGTELALELKELGLCLEEYIDMLTAQAAEGARK